jgi:hypothetical protein
MDHPRRPAAWAGRDLDEEDTMSAPAATVTTSQPPQPVEVEEQPAVRIGHGELLRAIQKDIQENSVSVQVAGVGTVRLPALDSLAWIGGLATLAAVGLLEWPVAAAIGVGHLLSRQRHLRLLKEFGEALESA